MQMIPNVDPLLACGIFVALILVTGYAVVCAILGEAETGLGERQSSNQRHWAELFGLSFAAGSATISFLLFFASLAGSAPNSRLLIAIGAGGIGMIIALFRRHQLLTPTVPTPRKKVDPMFILAVAAAATVIAAAFNVQARSGWPGLGDIDPFAIWMFKAKWVALAPLRPIPPAFLDPGLSYSHQDYPLGLPFLVAGVYAAGGGVADELGKTLLLPQYLAVVAIIYSALRRFHRRALALTITAVFAAAPVLTRNAGLVVAETPLLLAYGAALAMLLRWMDHASRQNLILAGLFAASAAFTKNEGLALLPFIGLAALLFAFVDGLTNPPSRRDRLIDWCAAAGTALVLVTPWLIFRSFLPRTHEDYGGKLRSLHTVTQNLPRLSEILPYLLGEMRDMQNAGPIWYVLVLSAAIGWRAFSRAPVMIFWLLLLVQLSLYTATFVVTPWSLLTLLRMITPKLLVQATPVVVLLIGLHLRPSRSVEPATKTIL